MKPIYTFAFAAMIMLPDMAQSDGSSLDLSSRMSPHEFRDWSNSLSNQDALVDLTEHLEQMSDFEAVVNWLESSGFRIDKTTPRKLSELSVKQFGYPEGEYYSLVFLWKHLEDGAIFSPTIMSKIRAWLFVSGFGISFHYTEVGENNSIEIEAMRISRTVN